MRSLSRAQLIMASPTRNLPGLWSSLVITLATIAPGNSNLSDSRPYAWAYNATLDGKRLHAPSVQHRSGVVAARDTSHAATMSRYQHFLTSLRGIPFHLALFPARTSSKSLRLLSFSDTQPMAYGSHVCLSGRLLDTIAGLYASMRVSSPPLPPPYPMSFCCCRRAFLNGAWILPYHHDTRMPFIQCGWPPTLVRSGFGVLSSVRGLIPFCLRLVTSPAIADATRLRVFSTWLWLVHCVPSQEGLPRVPRVALMPSSAPSLAINRALHHSSPPFVPVYQAGLSPCYYMPLTQPLLMPASPSPCHSVPLASPSARRQSPPCQPPMPRYFMPLARLPQSLAPMPPSPRYFMPQARLPQSLALSPQHALVLLLYALSPRCPSLLPPPAMRGLGTLPLAIELCVPPPPSPMRGFGPQPLTIEPCAFSPPLPSCSAGVQPLAVEPRAPPPPLPSCLAGVQLLAVEPRAFSPPLPSCLAGVQLLAVGPRAPPPPLLSCLAGVGPFQSSPPPLHATHGQLPSLPLPHSGVTVLASCRLWALPRLLEAALVPSVHFPPVWPYHCVSGQEGRGSVLCAVLVTALTVLSPALAMLLQYSAPVLCSFQPALMASLVAPLAHTVTVPAPVAQPVALLALCGSVLALLAQSVAFIALCYSAPAPMAQSVAFFAPCCSASALMAHLVTRIAPHGSMPSLMAQSMAMHAPCCSLPALVAHSMAFIAAHCWRLWPSRWPCSRRAARHRRLWPNWWPLSRHVALCRRSRPNWWPSLLHAAPCSRQFPRHMALCRRSRDIALCWRSWPIWWPSSRRVALCWRLSCRYVRSMLRRAACRRLNDGAMRRRPCCHSVRPLARRAMCRRQCRHSAQPLACRSMRQRQCRHSVRPLTCRAMCRRQCRHCLRPFTHHTVCRRRCCPYMWPLTRRV